MEHPVLWNLNWNFYDHFEENYKTEDDEGKAVRVNLPHTVKELPLSYFSHNETAMISTYAKELTLSEEPKERLILVFDGVMACFELYVNGRLAGEHLSLIHI